MKRPGLEVFVGAIALAYLVCAVFFPILGFEFADLDLYEHVIHNPQIRGLTGETLKHIFTSRCLTSYYPVRTLTYAIDHQIWGLNAAGFKLTNGLIHLANVFLVFWLILRLFRHWAAADGSSKPWWEAFVAACSAGVFAVHPVVVEPVVWVSGREELLMTLGALGCFHFHLCARRLSRDGGKRRCLLGCHVAAALCCAAACLSNAVAAVIPLLVVAWDTLMLDEPKLRKILYGTSALWVIGLATIAIKKLGAHGDLVAAEVAAFSVQRLALVLNVYWLNLKTLFWPRHLTVAYPRVVPEGPLSVDAILGGAAIVLTCWMLWKLRRRKLILYGLVWFGLALGPASQIMPHHIHRADRFLYLPLVGLIVGLAMGLRPLGNALKGRAAVTGAIAVGVLGLALLDALSANQVETWRSKLSLWEHCLRVAPNNAGPQRLFANSLAEAGQFDRAISHYQMALQLDPGEFRTLNNFAFYLATCDEEELRDYDLAISLANRACELTQWKDPRTRFTLAVACDSFAVEMEDRGEFGRAIQYYNKALHAKPEYEKPFVKLVTLLVTCSDDTLRNPDEAVRVAEWVCGRTEYRDPLKLGILAEAYAAAGRLDEAVAVSEKAIRLAQAAGDAEMVDDIRRWIEEHQEHPPP